MASTNPFKLRRRQLVHETDIENLFLDLKGRSEDIQYLRSHQADVLRDYYQNHRDSSDVGIELPTGSGKTLVGLLIGEWRRRNLGQRILYLCPTRQLANQINEQSTKYGINARVFIGSKRDYDAADLSRYQNSEIIAISTYRGLFNVSPGIDDSQTIILDDAHGAESYIGDMWSVNISRNKHSDIYYKILEIFERDLPPRFVEVIHSRTRERITHHVEKVPFGAFYRSLEGLRRLLDTINDTDKTLFFSWRAISDGLHACHIYISYDNILIRPYIPPTLTHRPFAEARQRIYMSATLGRGGELERITGVNRIHRIATPKTYENRGVGRRFFLFPDFAMNPTDYYPWVVEKIASVDRSLILCPSGFRATKYHNFAQNALPPIHVFTADDVEETLLPFVQTNRCLLLLTNRYDGIDLPGGICKLIVIDGLPTGTNLQEAFLDERLGLDVILKERIKTRIQQASGRCTRADTESVAVLMLDRKLMNYCARKENQEIFHPELRAELELSLQQGTDSFEQMNTMLNSFFNKDEFWQEAEKLIEELRNTSPPSESEDTKLLDTVVDYEVDFSYAMWSGNYDRAVERGKRITDRLTHRSLDSYRALWYYFTAAAAMSAAADIKEYEKIKDDYIARAKGAGGLVSWFPNALKSMESAVSEPIEDIERQALAVEGIIEILSELGPAGPKFERKIVEVEGLLQETEADKFDKGLRELGRLLGYSSQVPPGKGAPDACWQLENNLLLIFECKSDEDPDSGISIEDCRQTSFHHKYAEGINQYKNVKERYVCLVTPRTSIDSDAVHYGADVFHLHTTEIMELYRRTLQMLTESRALISAEIDDNVRERISQTMTRLELTQAQLIKRIILKEVSGLPNK